MAWLLTWLVHGLAIALVTRFALRTLPGLSAATRYAMWWAALVLVLILPIVRGLTLRTSAAGATAAAGAASAAGATGATGPAGAVAAGEDVVVADSGTSAAASASSSASARASKGDLASVSAVTPRVTGTTAHAVGDAVPLAPLGPLGPLAARIQSVSLPPVSLPRVPEWVLAIVIGLWLGTAMLGLGQIVYSVHAVRRLKESCRRMLVPRESELTMWSAVRGQGRSVRVRSSNCVRTAAVLGLTRPIIAMPRDAAAALTPHEIDQVVLHEYAHVQRYDDWTKLLQVLICAFAGWHPAVRLMMREIDFEREAACDDYVVDVTGAPRAYARCLTKMIELMPTPGLDLAAVPHAFSSARHTTTRIERLLDRKRPSGRLAVMPAMAGSATLATLAFCTLHALPLATDLPRPSSALTPDAMLASASDAGVDADVDARVGRAGVTRDANVRVGDGGAGGDGDGDGARGAGAGAARIGGTSTPARGFKLRIAAASTLPIGLPFSRFSPLSRLTDARLGASRVTPLSVSAAPTQLGTSLTPSSPGAASRSKTTASGVTHGDGSIESHGAAGASVTPNAAGTSGTHTSTSVPDARQAPAANVASASPTPATPSPPTSTTTSTVSTPPHKYARDNRTDANTRRPDSTPDTRDIRAMRNAAPTRAEATFALGPVIAAGDSDVMPGASVSGHIGRAWDSTRGATSKAVGVGARAVGTATKTAGGATKTATNKAAATVKASGARAFGHVKRTLASVF
jgi:beta-lactamase regulating signal transducer with metallopeptidase domain